MPSASEKPSPRRKAGEGAITECRKEEADAWILERAGDALISTWYRWTYLPDPRLSGWAAQEDRERVRGLWGCYVQGPRRFGLFTKVSAREAVCQWIHEFYPGGFDKGVKFNPYDKAE